MSDEKIVDAEFVYVAGPMRVGDPHPTKKGWVYTGEYDRNGRLLWYRPPARFWRWLRPALWWCLAGFILIGIVGGLYAGI